MADRILSSLEENVARYGPDGSKEIFYYSAGPRNGPLLIFVHGWPALPQTWYHQLDLFSRLGFWCVAPDMPGYGRSTSAKVVGDYTQERIVEGLLALLADTGRDRAVWIGHDWGAGCVWSLAVHHPEVCAGVANLVLPYRTVEAGIEQASRGVNREVYPRDKYPDGQWSYIRFFSECFDKAVSFQDRNVDNFAKLLFGREEVFQRGQDPSAPKADGRHAPAPTATTFADGGPFGGSDTCPDASKLSEDDIVMPEYIVQQVIDSLKRNGFYGPTAYYVSDAANKEYSRAVKTLDLPMPVLYVEARDDSVCETVSSRLADAQRRHCKKLSEVSLEGGHWLQLERPDAVNAALARWLASEVSDEWPGSWRTATRS